MKILFFIITAFTLSSCAVAKIQDCPEEKIINRMPTIIDGNAPKIPNEYYIYKGERREIKEFDAAWIEKNCPNIKVQEVY
ncbi:MAG: hypothetical protein ACK40Y_06175 [Cloacibacterium caeni]